MGLDERDVPVLGSLWSLQQEHVDVSLLLSCCRQRRRRSSKAFSS